MTTRPVRVIIQARLGSERLPGKVLRPLAAAGGETHPLLGWLLKRVQLAPYPVVVATTLEPSDNPLSEWLHQEQIPCFRGPRDDVMLRYLQTARQFAAAVVVRVTGDNPLTEPFALDAAVKYFLEKPLDYFAYENLPLGMAAEVFSLAALETAYAQNPSTAEKEHVTIWFKNHRQQIRFGHGPYPKLAAPPPASLRLTVDTAEDFALMQRLFREFGDGLIRADVAKLADWLARHPELTALNQHVTQRQ